ncbi:MAG TPA: hypothetical protein VGP46_10525 [Acidimicrobiales bacterium]|nr:hypothetical protein [Acidimicrobiales bacterium]
MGKEALVKAEVARGFGDVLGTNLIALYAYGSGVDGSLIAGFSDLDVAAFLAGRPLPDDLFRLHRRLDRPIEPFSYLQVKYIDTTAVAKATLVPNSFELLAGQLADEGSYVFRDDELLTEARRWLEVLPALVADDGDTWSVAVGGERRLRHVRLLTTRVKPAVRSWLCLQGVAPTVAFTANWQQMAELLTPRDRQAGSLISHLHSLLPPADDDAAKEAGEVALRLLWCLLGDAPADEGR